MYQKLQYFSAKQIITSKTEETKRSGSFGIKRKMYLENWTFRLEIVKNSQK